MFLPVLLKSKSMGSLSQLRIDPASLAANGSVEALELVVAYTEWFLAKAVLKRVPALTAGLNAKVTLVAVHTVPYPLPFECPAAAHACLVEQVLDLASLSPVPVFPQVVLARYQDEGFRFVLKPESMVLIGARKHWFRTAEERLARTLARAGHRVALLHVA